MDCASVKLEYTSVSPGFEDYHVRLSNFSQLQSIFKFYNQCEYKKSYILFY